jgi:hypothetical protein
MSYGYKWDGKDPNKKISNIFFSYTWCKKVCTSAVSYCRWIFLCIFVCRTEQLYNRCITGNIYSYYIITLLSHKLGGGGGGRILDSYANMPERQMHRDSALFVAQTKRIEESSQERSSFIIHLRVGEVGDQLLDATCIKNKLTNLPTYTPPPPSEIMIIWELAIALVSTFP